MGRPAGSRNRPKGDIAGIGDNSNGLRDAVSGDELLGYIERIEHLNEQHKEISVDRSQIYTELKTAGYDRATIRAIIARRAMTAEQRDAAAALMDQYTAALGEFSNTPLGQAGADRVREVPWGG